MAGGAVIAVWSQQRAELPAVNTPARASTILRSRYTGNFNTESRSVTRAAQLCAEVCFSRSELGASFNDCFTELIQCCTDGNSTECAKALRAASNTSPAKGPALIWAQTLDFKSN